jgi:hypothetical protein
MTFSACYYFIVLIIYCILVGAWLIQKKVLDLHSLYLFVQYPEATMSRKQLRMTTKSYKHNKLINCHNTHWNYWTMTSTLLHTIHHSKYHRIILLLTILIIRLINQHCHEYNTKCYKGKGNWLMYVGTLLNDSTNSKLITITLNILKAPADFMPEIQLFLAVVAYYTVLYYEIVIHCERYVIYGCT